MKSKICNSCLKRKPINKFHKDKYKKDGLATLCKECRAITGQKRRDKVKNTKITITHKTCASCRKRKSINKFNRYSNNLSGFYHICRECDKERKMQYYYQNIEKYRENYRRLYWESKYVK